MVEVSDPDVVAVRVEAVAIECERLASNRQRLAARRGSEYERKPLAGKGFLTVGLPGLEPGTYGISSPTFADPGGLGTSCCSSGFRSRLVCDLG